MKETFKEMTERWRREHPNNVGCANPRCGLLPDCAGNAGRLPPAT